MQKRGRPRVTAGRIYGRSGSKALWIRYHNRDGRVVKESSGTSDREEAERFLRSRLDARDDGSLSMLLRSKALTFNECADWFLEKRSKPPYRAEKSHQENLKVLKKLRPVFGSLRLSEIIGRGNRGLFRETVTLRKEDQYEARDRLSRKIEAGDSAPRVPGASADTQCRGQTEVARGKSVPGS